MYAPQSTDTGQKFWIAILELVVVLKFICRWQHGDSLHYTRFHYEHDNLSVNEDIPCFILCISLVIRLSKIKNNIYFSPLTINEINETAQFLNFGGNGKIHFILRIRDELTFSGAILVCWTLVRTV